MTTVSVVGAGLAGLSFAAAGQRRGLNVQVVDERPLLGGGAALTLWPNALAALDHVGLGEAVRAIGMPVAGGQVRRNDGSLIRRLDPVAAVRALGEPARVVDRGELQAVLLDAVGPGTVTLDSAVVDPSDLDGEVVVGADGYRSVVARRLNPGLREHAAGYVAWRGVAPIAIDPSQAALIWGDRCEAGVVPMTGDRTYWFATTVGGDDRARPDARQWPTPLAEVIDATEPAAVLRHDMVDRERLKVWHDERCVVIGDAAHPMQPGLGQGGCAAIEDGVLLADLLADASSAQTAFVRLEARRRRRTDRLVRRSRRLGAMLHGRYGRGLVLGARIVPTRALLRAMSATAGRRAWDAT